MTFHQLRGRRPHQHGPKPADHPSIGEKCAACGVPFAEGDYTALIPLGPGTDAEARKAAAEGRVFSPISTEVHWACATGEEPD